jgi:diguanylate cyclase (GGDEF)-like protein/PAS domain S-box-containing protein
MHDSLTSSSKERPLTGLFTRLSLKGKLTAVTVGFFLLFIWTLVIFSVTVLQSQFEQVLSEEQFADVSRLAVDLDSKLDERKAELAGVAQLVPADLRPETLDPFLASYTALHIAFSGGIAIIGLDGKTIADFPAVPGRRGAYYGDRDYFRQALETGKPYIDKPFFGRALKRPILNISVPVTGPDGKIRAVMTGITDLTAPNFLGVITGNDMTGKSEFFVFSPRDNMIVAASDGSRAMTALPPHGTNPLFDRFKDGFEGSGISTSSQGIPNLYSAKRVPSAGWVVMAGLPIEVAFGPVRAMQRYVVAAAAILTLCALLVLRWSMRKVLAPLDEAGTAMQRMTHGEQPLAPLPVTADDEVGQLIGHFNSLVEDRRRYEAALAESEQRFRLLVESAPDGIFVQTRKRFAYLNAAALALFGATHKEDLIGTAVIERAHPDSCPRIVQMQETKHHLPPEEEVYLRMDGTPIDVEISAAPFTYGGEEGALVFMRDIGERKRAEKTQQRLNRALRLLSECNMALVHAEREPSLLEEICKLIVETGGYRMTWVGYSESDDGKPVHPVCQAGEATDYLDRIRVTWGGGKFSHGPTGMAIRTGQPQVNQNFLSNPDTLPWRDEAIRHGFHSSIALPLRQGKDTFGALTIYSADPDSFAEDEVKLLLELATDLAFGISTLRTRAGREAAEAQLAFLAHYDPLTHLPNQVLLRDRFEQALARRHGASVALLCLDLDNFKRINDSLGHAAGDRLLVAVVERLRSCLRDTDTVSRQGGDEFVILLSGIEDASAAGRVAQTILDAVSEPFEIDDNAVTTSFSIGISLYPNDGLDFDTLLKNADAALFHAKDSGRDTYHFFTASMNIDALARMQLHSNLRRAVKNREFVLHYQAQCEAGSNRICGVEALVRWHREEDGLVLPGRFIPLAEETGLIVQIGEWVLREACRQAKEWQDAGMLPLTVAVNLSAQQFRRDGLLETVVGALRDSGLDPRCLELELTESMLLQDAQRVLEVLHGLKALGVKLSIDDFGTGYSSLAYLKRLAVDKLKIDQSFVRDLADNPEDAAIVRAVIQLGHSLQLQVIAEGVETERQLAALRSFGCDEIQGYLLSRPLPAEDFAAFVARRTQEQ